MKLSNKDREQIRLMAGSIAAGFAQQRRPEDISPSEFILIGTVSAKIAIETMLTVDTMVADINGEKQ
jgi:hypothetical protein